MNVPYLNCLLLLITMHWLRMVGVVGRQTMLRLQGSAVVTVVMQRVAQAASAMGLDHIDLIHDLGPAGCVGICAVFMCLPCVSVSECAGPDAQNYPKSCSCSS